MRLICLHEEAVRALTSLHVPFDDLTPEGLWGSEYHMVGIGPEQREVLVRWGIDLQDVTPKAFEATRTTSANPLDQLSYPSTALRDGARLRTAHGGRRVEAEVRGGKVVVGDRTFDSPSHARRELGADTADRELWEVFDDGANEWRILDRQWERV